MSRRRSCKKRIPRPLVAAAIGLALILPGSLACNSLPGLGRIFNLLGGFGGLGGGLLGGPASTAFTLILSLIQNIQPPPNPLEADFLTTLTPTAEGKFIADAPMPIPITPRTLATLSDAASYAAVGPDGRIYYTEEDTGRVRAFDVTLEAVAAATIVDVHVNSSGPRGLKGIAFALGGDRMYLCYDRSVTDGDTGAMNESADARLVSFPFSGGAVVGPETVLFSTPPSDPAVPSDLNGIGPCIVAPDGFLYVGHGDRNNRLSVLDLADNNASGRILRFNQDGSIPLDNPSPNSPGFAAGFRNPSALAVDTANGFIWLTDIGSSVSDELNLLSRGRFYGWPLVQGYANTMTEEDFDQLVSLVGQAPFMDFAYQKLDPRGLAIIRGGPYGPDLEGNVLIGESIVVPSVVHRFRITTDFVISRSVAVTLPDSAGRIRDLLQHPDGRLYAVCEHEIVRLDPS